MKNVHLIKKAALSIWLFAGCAALAQPDGAFQSKGTGGDWDDYTNAWECFDAINGWGNCTAKPGSGDYATILENDTITIRGTSEGIEDLIIEDGSSTPGKLEILSGDSAGASKLTFDASGSLTMHAVDTEHATISFGEETGNTHPGELHFNFNATVGGKIAVGTTGGVIDPDTNTFTLSGAINVTGGNLTVDGNFEQDGMVTVDGAYTLTSQGTGVSSGSSGDWHLDASGGKIRFNQTAAVSISATGGEFQLTEGTLDVDKQLTTNGSLLWNGSGATIDVAANEPFRVNHN